MDKEIKNVIGGNGNGNGNGSGGSIRIELTKEGLPLCTNTVDILYRQSVEYQKLGRYRDAYTVLEEALKLDSSHKLLQEQHARMKLRTSELDRHKNALYRQEFLKSVGYDTPSDYLYLSMSLLSYQDKDSLEFCMDRRRPPSFVLNPFLYLRQQRLAEIEPFCDILQKYGWDLGVFNEDFNIEGDSYFGVSFVNTQTKRVIVAQRGTDSVRDIVSDVQIIRSAVPVQYNLARMFTERVAKQYPGFAMSHTGHSLGAVLAELLAYNRNELAITVDSLGIQGVLDTLRFEAKDPLILCYVSSPNLVNTYMTHVGRMRSVIPTYPKTAAWDWVRSKNASLFFTNLLKGDISSHHIESILNSFDAESQLVSHYYNVQNWPSSVNQRLGLQTLYITHGLMSENPYSTDPVMKQNLATWDYVVEPVHPSRLPLWSFSKPIQEMLLSLNEKKQEPNPIFYDRRIWRLHSIQQDQVVIHSDPNLFTAEDFRNYIEHKYIQEIKVANLS